MKSQIIILLIIFLNTLGGISQITNTILGEYLSEMFIKDDQSLLYRIMYPIGFDQMKKYPLVVFLHGAGERGSDNNTQLVHGSKLFKDSLQSYPAIVIFPQCPKDDYWANLYRPDEGGSSRIFDFHTDEGPNPSMSMVIDLINQILDKPYVDNNRFYLSGLSMGAMGVWELLWRMPENITAAIPICGGGPPQMASRMKGVPIWAFHGVKDDVVHPRYTRNMVTSVQKSGGIAKVTLYPDANHNSWDPAFSDPKILSWLFSKTKN